MKKELLQLKPIGYKCPFCGEWHNLDRVFELEYYNSEANTLELRCENERDTLHPCKLSIWFEEEWCHYQFQTNCDVLKPVEGSIKIRDIETDPINNEVLFEEEWEIIHPVGYYCCAYHKYCDPYQAIARGSVRNEVGRKIRTQLGFEFSKEDWNRGMQSDKKEKKEEQVEKQEEKEEEVVQKEATSSSIESDQPQQNSDQSQQPQQNNDVKEKATMKGTTAIWNRLYKHSPEENVTIAKQWVEKYKPTLQWAIPVASIYGAYRILNSKVYNLSVENVAEECEKQLGFGLDILKDKKALKELMVLGGVTAGAYAAIQVATSIYKDGDKQEITAEQVDESMGKLEGARKKFGFIQPKTEALLPVAVSVIMIYLMKEKKDWIGKAKEKVEDFGFTAGVWLDMVKLFISEKLHMDLDNEAERQKMKNFAILFAVVVIGVLLYGKKILGSKANTEEAEESQEEKQQAEKIKSFMAQIISIMEKMMPAAFASISTILVAKKVLKPSETTEVKDEAYCEEELPDATVKSKEPEDPEETEKFE